MICCKFNGFVVFVINLFQFNYNCFGSFIFVMFVCFNFFIVFKMFFFKQTGNKS